jgi:hypothetical protein
MESPTPEIVTTTNLWRKTTRLVARITLKVIGTSRRAQNLTLGVVLRGYTAARRITKVHSATRGPKKETAVYAMSAPLDSATAGVSIT